MYRANKRNKQFEFLDMLKKMFDQILMELFVPIKKEAEELNDKPFLHHIQCAFTTNIEPMIVCMDSVDKRPLKNRNLKQVHKFCREQHVEYDFLLAKRTKNKRSLVKINSTIEYLAFHEAYLHRNMHEPYLNYSKKCLHALNLITDTFCLFNSAYKLLDNGEKFDMHDLASYSIQLKSLIEDVAFFSNNSNKSFLKNKKANKEIEKGQFLAEMESLISKNNDKVLPACKEYYENNQVKEINKYLKKNNRVGNWRPGAQKSRVKAIKARYYRLKMALQEKNNKKD